MITSTAGSYNGVAFGPGTRIHVQSVEGLDLPALRTSDEPRPRDHGSFPGRHLLDPRVMVWSFGLRGDDLAGFDAVADDVATMTIPRDDELPLTFDNAGKVIFCRPLRRSLARDFTQPQRLATAAVEFVASDPRVYSAALSALNTSLPVSQPGATYPWTYPISYGAASSGGSLTVTNEGNFGAPWSAVISAGSSPLTEPRIELITTGEAVKLERLTLSPGESLALFSKDGAVLLNGVSPRTAFLSVASRWFEIPPGTHTVRFFAASGGSDATLSLYARSAWI